MSCFFIKEVSFIEAKQTVAMGVRAAVPTAIGYIGIATALGVIGRNAGLSILEIALMSLMVYAGSAQFILCSMILAHSSLLAMVATTFLVNLRHLLLSLSLRTRFAPQSLAEGLAVGSLLTDETFSVASLIAQQGASLSAAWLYGLNATAYLSWFAASVFGAVVSDWLWLPPQALGLDYALTAMFAGLLALQLSVLLSRRMMRIFGLLCVVAVAVYGLSWWVSAEVAVLSATVLGCTLGVLFDDN